MILSDSAIKKEMAAGNIIISPYQAKHQNPNSVDLTLNKVCKVYRPDFLDTDKSAGSTTRAVPAVLDCKLPNQTMDFEIPEAGYVLNPNIVYLYCVNEKIGVKAGSGLCARVEGKSSLARLGLFIVITAGWIDSGFEGSLVLELHCVQPIRIYPNMKICQICFLRVEGNVEEEYGSKEGSKYMNQAGVVESKMHLNFDEKK